MLVYNKSSKQQTYMNTTLYVSCNLRNCMSTKKIIHVWKVEHFFCYD